MINEHVCIESTALRLVPYLPHHVHRYHEWMCEPELLAATESEPLSLAEEQENQQSWLRSLDKLTFILLAPVARTLPEPQTHREICEGVEPSHVVHAGPLRSPQETVQGLLSTHPEACRCSAEDLRSVQASSPMGLSLDEAHDDLWLEAAPPAEAALGTVYPLPVAYVPGSLHDLVRGVPTPPPPLPSPNDSTYVMIGDCNLFLLDADELDSGGDATDVENAQRGVRCFEVEVMVADKAFRRRGLAEEAVRLLMQYAVSVLGATCFVAKILDDNTGSLRLFEEKLHFCVYKEVKVFHEIHLVRQLNTESARRAWELECEAHSTRAREPVASGDGSSYPCWYWCRPYDAALEASMKVLTRLP